MKMQKADVNEHEDRLERAGKQLFATFKSYRGHSDWGDALSMPDAERDAAIAEDPVRNLDARYFYYFGWKSLFCSGGNARTQVFLSSRFV